MDNHVFLTYKRTYRLLEKQLTDISEYVAISGRNFDTFSDRFVIFFLSVCSEVDSIADELCKKLGVIDPKERYGINNKVGIILKTYKDARNWICITKPPFETIKLVPFANFNDNGAADWWKDYNSVKHNRTEKNESGMYNYQLAHLKNVLYAMSAFYLILSRMSEDGYVESEIFEIERK